MNLSMLFIKVLLFSFAPVYTEALMSWTRKNPPKRVSLVERDSDVRSFHVFRVNTKTLKIILLDQVSKSANLMTDESSAYVKIGKEFASHESV